LFNSLAGFALEVGDRLLINGEEVIFKGWVDQSQTSIEVKEIADAAVIKQVRAKEIQSLARSQDSTATQTSAPNSTQNEPEKSSDPSSSKETGSTEASDRGSSDRVHDDQKSSENFDHAEVLPEPETIETPKEPEYNAWEVWTYLERQRVNTLKLLNTFQAEWEANRFVREAERSAPSNLRVHYEVRPIWLDEAEIKRSYQNTEASHKSNDHQSNRDAKDYVQDYDDAIDVEVVTDSR
jgi:hypothetical protein